jgi:hypothetical protein
MPTSFAANSSRAPVSVLVPTYNGSELLLETIDSILSQKFAPAEDSRCKRISRLGDIIKLHIVRNILRHKKILLIAAHPKEPFCSSSSGHRFPGAGSHVLHLGKMLTS